VGLRGLVKALVAMFVIGTAENHPTPIKSLLDTRRIRVARLLLQHNHANAS